MPEPAITAPSPAAPSVGTTTVDRHQAAVLGWMEDVAPYGILTTDTDLRVVSWNEWLETHSGIAAPLALGRPLLELFPDLCERKLDEHFRRALAGQVVILSAAFHEYLLPFPSTLPDAVSAHMQQTARIAPLSFNDQLCGTIAIIEDVSQRESQSASLARRHERDQLLAACLAQLLRTREPEAVVRELFSKVADYLGVHTFLSYLLQPGGNRLRLHAVAGIPEKELSAFADVRLGDSMFGTAAAERRLIVANHLQASGNPHTGELKALGFRAAVCHPLIVGDRLIGVLAFATRNHDAFRPEDIEFIGTVSQYVAVALERAMNEAALDEAQQALKQHAHSLETKVQERTAKLQDTIVQLESFSYTVAHDLRAPIRALKGYAELLLEESPPIAQDKSRQYLQRIVRASNRLDALTRDLLQFSRVSRQDVELTKIDLPDLVQDVRSLRPALQDQVLVVEEPLHPVLANRTLLQQCLSNLFDNAVKFVTPGAQPRIVLRTEKMAAAQPQPATTASHAFSPAAHLHAGTNPAELSAQPPLEIAETAERIRIWIEDNGIGIAPESRDKIFGIFERLNPSDEFEGTGIGLAIVARAMQRMGGACGVESGPGSGSRFWLELMPAH